MMHRRTDLWGPDGATIFLVSLISHLTQRVSHTALKFDPDRFLDERVKKYLTKNPFIFIPLDAVPRICVGQQVSCTACLS